MSNPDDRYRRLLSAYPAWYRSERGEEILSTLRESAQARGGRVSLGEAVSLLAHGLAVRFDLSERGALGALAARLASPGLALAALLATVALVFGELLAPSYMGGPAHPGPFLTVGPIAYAAWIAAFVVDIATSSRFGRLRGRPSQPPRRRSWSATTSRRGGPRCSSWPPSRSLRSRRWCAPTRPE